MKNTSFVSPLAFWAQAVGAASSEMAVTGAIKAYERGDYDEALDAFIDLANDGSNKAQHYLAQMYANGQGTETDYESALSWYLEAAHGGLAEAQAQLGQVYADGSIGVAKNLSKSYAWMDIAAAAGNSEAAKSRDALAPGMTSAELKQGRSLSIELAAKPLYLLQR